MHVRLITIMVMGAVGCVDATDDLDEATQEVVSANGVSLNGVSLNGVSLNGVSLNGVSLNGVSLNGVSLNGVSLNGVSLNGTTLTGKTAAGVTTTGATAGSQLNSTLSNGATLKLRIDSAATLPAPNADVWSYGVSYFADGGWMPLCGTGVGALAVAGSWDTRAGVVGGGAYTASTTSFTFACRAMTIAKCVELGYKTTLGRTPQLLSCVRMLRGDYCGNGSTWTVTGNQVNLYDGIGVQADTQAWDVEAEWTANGARCISASRDTRFASSGLGRPPCVKDLSVPSTTTCGKQGFASAVLISEIPPVTR
jgi:ADYC domain/Pentapeptide repeats (8 copies)